jgi:hypothetical protein
MAESTEEEVRAAVTQYVYDRHGDLTRSDVIGFSDDELEEMVVTKSGHLVFTVEDVKIEEKEMDGDTPVWYVSATLFFLTADDPLEGSTDTYEAYQDIDGTWCIEWDSC